MLRDAPAAIAEHPPPATVAPRVRSGIGHFEDELLRRSMGGDDVAREELVRRMLPVARRIARRYSYEEYAEDLEQAAGLGLAKALARYDPKAGADLVGYAWPTMLGEVRRWLRDNSWAIRPPRELAETSLRVGVAIDELSAHLGRSPSAQELAAHLDTTAEKVLAALEARRGRRAVSLDEPNGAGADGDERTLAHRLGSDDADLDHVLERTWVERLSAVLEPRERAILDLYFVEDLSQRQIARRLGVSQMQVCRVLRRAVDRLREAAAAA